MPLAEHDYKCKSPKNRLNVSIHVPLAEHDMSCVRRFAQCLVSIHVPLAEHDLMRPPPEALPLRFNSRAPRGARHDGRAWSLRELAVSIHVPLAEHDLSLKLNSMLTYVSIHVPLAEHDFETAHADS